jgi:hypothetical protein
LNLVPSQWANAAKFQQSVAAHAPHPRRASAVSPSNRTREIEKNGAFTPKVPMVCGFTPGLRNRMT